MSTSHPQRLIIVDDEPVILELLASVFEDEPYEVVTCATGAEGLAAMESGVDVLLTDKNLPDVGGLDLLRHAKEKDPNSEVIIITGYASIDTVVAALQLDAFDYIVKPPKNVFDVRRKVRQAFEKRAIVRENQQLVAELKEKNDALQHALGELKQMQAKLIQSEKLAGIGTLAAGIAHEISSPLFGIMGLAEAIVDEEDGDLARQYAGDIVEYSKSIKNIVVDLTGYSRTAEREYLTTVDLRATIGDAVRLVCRSIQASEDVVQLDVQEGLYLQARTNEIQQIFVNLVKNAIEAVDEVPERKGQVRINAHADDSGVTIEVSDNGPGISEDQVSVIFDPFYTTKAPGSGTGLGLNIVYRIVTKYRGNIIVRSDEAEGTSFTLHFPADEEET